MTEEEAAGIAEFGDFSGCAAAIQKLAADQPLRGYLAHHPAHRRPAAERRAPSAERPGGALPLRVMGAVSGDLCGHGAGRAARSPRQRRGAPGTRFAELTGLLLDTIARLPAANEVVPLWYHELVAMSLRLDDEDSALLKALADAEHVSLHEAALRAIRRSAREVAHTERVREATAEMLGRWGEVLDRLGRA
jgi:uncharacterized protein (DUF1778 family)